jgi:hypothetical protein
MFNTSVKKTAHATHWFRLSVIVPNVEREDRPRPGSLQARGGRAKSSHMASKVTQHPKQVALQ